MRMLALLQSRSDSRDGVTALLVNDPLSATARTEQEPACTSVSPCGGVQQAGASACCGGAPG